MDDLRVPPKIAAIIEQLHTQDNRITESPLFAVQQRRRIYGLDSGYSDGVVWVGEDGETTDADVDGARELGYVDKWEFVTGCFTEQGCKDFIACNGHNLNEPHIYAYSGYRNAEFIAVREWLMSLRPAPTQEPADATAWTLYQHDDGRYAAWPGTESAPFTAGEPAWHRVGPVSVPADATGAMGVDRPSAPPSGGTEKDR